MTTSDFTKLWFGDPAKWESKQLLSFEELVNFLDAYVDHCQEASKALQFCSCPFVMVMRGEDDKPYCGSCKLLVDDFPDFSTE